MDLEEISLKVRGIASIIEAFATIRHTNVRDSEYGLSLLSSQLYECADEIMKLDNN